MAILGCFLYLSLYRPGQAADEILLQEHKEDKDGDHRHGHPRRDGAHVRGEHPLQSCQPHREGHPDAGMHHQRRPEEVIPRGDKGENSHRRERRADHRQQHVPPGAQLARPS